MFDTKCLEHTKSYSWEKGEKQNPPHHWCSNIEKIIFRFVGVKAVVSGETAKI